MGAWSLAGALAAGAYGIVHSQLTYTLAPEYFTRFKFIQFAWADFGFPPRLRVAGIGFLATWWVGFAATWFFARLVATWQDPATLGRRVRGLWLAVLGAAALGGTLGFLAGPTFYLADDDWREALGAAGVVDLPAFARVAGIHLGGYVGALLGWLAWMFPWAGQGRS
jgi:hypothetical protein